MGLAFNVDANNLNVSKNKILTFLWSVSFCLNLWWYTSVVTCSEKYMHPMHAHIHACTNTHTHAYKHTYIHSHTHMQLFPELFLKHAHVCTHTHAHMHSRDTWTHSQACTLMHSISHTYMHTHGHAIAHAQTDTEKWCGVRRMLRWGGGGGGNSVYTMWHRFFVRLWHSQQTHHRLTILSFLFWCFLQYPHRAIKPQRLWTKSTPGNELLRVLDSCDTCLSQNHPTVKSSGLLWHLHFTKSSDCKEFWILGTPAFYKIIRL